MRLVDVHRGVFLYGDSGIGKSSLLNAGLFPQALELGFQPIRVRVQPRSGEELVIEPIAISEEGTETLPCVLVGESSGSAREVLSIDAFEAAVREAALTYAPLVVFDQFEEILTLFDDADELRVALAAMVIRLLRDDVPVKLLFAFREDYLGRVKQLLGARPELIDQALRLGPPASDSLDTIIRGPFARFPGRFERELDAGLAGQLATALAQRFGTGDVSLSEVQTVCLRLWRAPDPERLLREKSVQGLLEDELGEALDGFPPKLRVAAVSLLSQMVTAAGTRNVISAEDLRQRVLDEDAGIAPDVLDEALTRLEEETKLVRRERRRGLYLYEITSEFLVPWINQRREELRLAHERRKSARRLRVLGSIVVSLLIVVAAVAVVAVWALDQRAQAERERADAQTQRSEALVQRLRAREQGLRARRQAAQATSLALQASAFEPIANRPDASLALAFEAYRISPRAEIGPTLVDALVAYRQSGLRGVLSGRDALLGVAVSHDGKLVATAGHDGTIRVWEVATHRRVAVLSANRRPLLTVAFSPDGRLAAAGNDGFVRMWDIRAGRVTLAVRAHPRSVHTVAVSADGKRLASGGIRRTGAHVGRPQRTLDLDVQEPSWDRLLGCLQPHREDARVRRRQRERPALGPRHAARGHRPGSLRRRPRRRLQPRWHVARIGELRPHRRALGRRGPEVGGAARPPRSARRGRVRSARQGARRGEL